MPNPLDPVIEWYRLTLDALRVTVRVLERGPSKVAVDPGTTPPVTSPTIDAWAVTSKHAVLFGLNSGVAVGRLEDAKIGLERLAILELAAVFERSLRNHLTTAAAGWIPPAHPVYQDRVRDAVSKDIEYWPFQETLVEVFAAVDGNVRGLVKKVIKYRDWVSHGRHTEEPAPENMDAEEAYKRLTDFLTAAGLVP